MHLETNQHTFILISSKPMPNQVTRPNYLFYFYKAEITFVCFSIIRFKVFVWLTRD